MARPITRLSRLGRRFGGKEYKADNRYYWTKAHAKKHAKYLRKKGNNVRVVSFPGHGSVVYYRRKGR